FITRATSGPYQYTKKPTAVNRSARPSIYGNTNNKTGILNTPAPIVKTVSGTGVNAAVNKAINELVSYNTPSFENSCSKPYKEIIFVPITSNNPATIK